MLKRYFLNPLLALLLAASFAAQAQTGSVGIGTTAPDASAALDVSSTSKGLLPPRLSIAQRDAIASPAAGLTIYNTTTGKLNTWDGTRWDEALSTNQQTFQAGQAVSFGYTGGPQTYTVPTGVTSLQVDASGAQGGSSLNGPGGLGARVQATLGVTPGQVLQINIGGSGSFDFTRASAGGFNGGGSGVLAASGGGATDIRVGSGQLTDRLLVAGGGGGGGAGYAGYGSTQGGAGGGPTGGNGTYTDPGGQPNASGSGATQTSGGNSGGVLGTGGQGKGGGGGGYYGGGGATSRGTNVTVSTADGGGGGGSSWVTPSGSFAITMTAGYQTNNGSLTLTPVVYPAPAINGANIVNVAGTWNVNGADVYRLGGNVGIGTSSPTATLEVSGSSSSVKLGGLAGTGTRMVTAGPAGTLSTQALPTDAQQLSISGSTLALTNGGSVALPGDNLGNHTATQNLSLGANLLTGNGGSTGLSVSSSGQVGIGTSGAATQKLEVAGSVKISGTGNGLTFPDGTTQTSASSFANLTGDVTSTGTTTIYNNVLPAAKGGAGTVTGLLRANGSGLVSAATPGTDYAAATGSAAYIQNQAGTAQAASFNVANTGTVGGLLTAGSATVGGNVGIGTTSAAPATQKLDVRGNVRLGTDGGNAGTGQAIEWVGPGVNTDPVGIYRVNPAADQSELRVVVGDSPDANDKFVVGRSSASTEGGVPTGTFTPTFTVRSDGNVGIGTTIPGAGLHIDAPEPTTTGLASLGVQLSGGTGDNPKLELRGDGRTPYIDFAENTNDDYTTRLRSIGGVLNVEGTGASGLLFKVNGSVQANNVVFTSDVRFKQHVRPIGSALASVLALRGVRYEWNALGVRHGGTAGAPQVGLLAQEVEKIYPELVSTDKDGYKAVNYAQLAPVLIEALKEQQQQIESLKAEAAAAKAEVGTANSRAALAEAKAAQATVTLETFEARLRRLEAGSAQAQR